MKFVSLGWIHGLLRYRWLWLALLAACLVKIQLTPGDNARTELSGATDTDAYWVQQSLAQDFGFRQENTMALVLEKADAKEELKAGLLRRFSQIERIQALPGKQDPALAIYFIYFQRDLPFIDAQALIAQVRAFIDPWEKRTGTATYLTGSVPFYADFVLASKQDASTAEVLAIAFALGVLIYSFGGLVAACLPLLLGITTLIFVNGFLKFFNLEITPVSLILNTILGLALSIDYAFFLVSRFQEELLQGQAPEQALFVTLQQTGKTIFFSGLIAFCSIAALWVPNLSVQRTNAQNLLYVVAIASLNALLCLPVLLAVARPWLDKPLFLSKLVKRRNPYPFWKALASHVVRYPKTYCALSCAVLLGLAAPALTMKLWDPVQTLAPPASESMRGYQRLKADGWGGELIPVHVLVDTGGPQGVYAPAAVSYIYDLSVAIQKHPAVASVQGMASWSPGWQQADYANFFHNLQTFRLLTLTSPSLPWFNTATGSHLALLNVHPREIMAVTTTYDIIDFIRRYAAAHPAYPVRVGGVVARANDFTVALYRWTPLMVALVLISIILVLFIYMKALVLPLKASIMNFLPILSAYGILTLIFQYGYFGWLLHTPTNGALINLVPMTLFCLVFGLSMDYEVLILSRISETYEACGDVKTAVVEGLARSSSVITGAALILLAVFIPSAFSASPVIKEISLGIAVAIFIDATLVRLFLVPSFMVLLGRWNWWNPFAPRSRRP